MRSPFSKLSLSVTFLDENVSSNGTTIIYNEDEAFKLTQTEKQMKLKHIQAESEFQSVRAGVHYVGVVKRPNIYALGERLSNWSSLSSTYQMKNLNTTIIWYKKTTDNGFKYVCIVLNTAKRLLFSNASLVDKKYEGLSLVFF